MHKPDPAKDAAEAAYRARQVPNNPERIRGPVGRLGCLAERRARRPRPAGQPLAAVNKLEDAATLFAMGGDDEGRPVEVVAGWF